VGLVTVLCFTFLCFFRKYTTFLRFLTICCLRDIFVWGYLR
jgi:hypothetical protein